MRRQPLHNWAWHEDRMAEDAERLARRKLNATLRMAASDVLPSRVRAIAHIVPVNELIVPVYQQTGGSVAVAEALVREYGEAWFGPMVA